MIKLFNFNDQTSYTLMLTMFTMLTNTFCSVFARMTSRLVKGEALTILHTHRHRAIKVMEKISSFVQSNYNYTIILLPSLFFFHMKRVNLLILYCQHKIGVLWHCFNLPMTSNLCIVDGSV